VTFVNGLIQGTLLGGYYAIIACGLSFMFGVMRIINLAHGTLAVLAAFLFWTLVEKVGLSPLLAPVIVLPVMAVIGWLLQRGILERSARAGTLVPILSTFGLAIVVENLLFQYYGANTRSLAPSIGDLSFDSWDLGGGIYIGKLAVFILLIAIVLLGGLQLFLTHTPVGRAIRATAEDPDTAELVGVNSRAINAVATAIALVTVAVAGMLLSIRAAFDAYSGPMQLIFAFEAAVIGGAGSLWGTLVGGIILGIAQTLGAQVHPLGFLIAGHAVFLIILVGRLYVSQLGLAGFFRALLRRPA
jgi:branched-chain amino acid transport system permease protein